MVPTWSLVFWIAIISFCLGSYAALHLNNALQDAQYFQSFVLHKLHGDTVCPQHYVCSPQTTP